MNFTNFGTQESVINGYVEHLVIVVIIAVLIPLFTYFVLRREIKIIEQVITILLLFLTIELLIYLLPFMINSIRNVF